MSRSLAGATSLIAIVLVALPAQAFYTSPDGKPLPCPWLCRAYLGEYAPPEEVDHASVPPAAVTEPALRRPDATGPSPSMLPPRRPAHLVAVNLQPVQTAPPLPPARRDGDGEPTEVVAPASDLPELVMPASVQDAGRPAILLEPISQPLQHATLSVSESMPVLAAPEITFVELVPDPTDTPFRRFFRALHPRKWMAAKAP